MINNISNLLAILSLAGLLYKIFLMVLVIITMIIGLAILSALNKPDPQTLLHSKLDFLIKIQRQMSDKTDKALADLKAIGDQVTKIGGETSTLLQKITDLENAANNDEDTPQSVLDAIAAVKQQAQVVDDLVPDAPAGDGGATDSGTASTGQ